MSNRFTLFCAAILFFILYSEPATARLTSGKDSLAMKMPVAPVRKFYIGSGLDGGIFSTAGIKRPGYDNTWGTLRFTYFINFGLTFNYDFSKLWGLYTGVDIKNIGFIEKKGDSTIKHRTYNLGVPIGIKVGNMKSRNYVFAGGGIDVPVNYREKGFVDHDNKDKFNEWFSGRTPAIMPYIFCGLSLKPGVSLKLQYYLTNYLNPDYAENKNGNTVKPYAGYDVHLLLFSIGFSMPYSKGPVYKHPEHKEDDNDKEI